MSNANFIISYDGPALIEHKMSVRDLIPVLEAVQKLLDTTNSILNDEGTEIQIHVQATEPKCFSIDFILQIVQHLENLPHDTFDALFDVNRLIRILFGKDGLIACIKRLKGNADNNANIPEDLLDLYHDLSIRKLIEKIISPLKKPGFEEISISDDRKKIIKIGKKEVPYFCVPKMEEKILSEKHLRLKLSIITLTFKKGNKWRLSHKDKTISVTITDDAFLREIDEDIAKFSKGDTLICSVLERQKQNVKGVKSEYILEKVITHKHAGEQLGLDLPTKKP